MYFKNKKVKILITVITFLLVLLTIGGCTKDNVFSKSINIFNSSDVMKGNKKGLVDTDGKYLYFIGGDNNFEEYNTIYKIPVDKISEDLSMVMGENTSCFDKAKIVYKDDSKKDDYIITGIYCYGGDVYFKESSKIETDKFVVGIYKLKNNGEKELISPIYNSPMRGFGSSIVGFNGNYIYGYTLTTQSILDGQRVFFGAEEASKSEEHTDSYGLWRINLKTGDFESVYPYLISTGEIYIDNGYIYYIREEGESLLDRKQHFERVNIKTLEVESIISYEQMLERYNSRIYLLGVKEGIAFILYEEDLNKIWCYDVKTGIEELFFKGYRGEDSKFNIDMTDDSVYCFNIEYKGDSYISDIELLTIYKLPIEGRNLTESDVKPITFRNVVSMGYDEITYFNIMNDRIFAISDNDIREGTFSFKYSSDFEDDDYYYNEVLSIYYNVLSTIKPSTEEAGFMLAYIDNDNIPELLLFDGFAHATNVGVYTVYKEYLCYLGQYGSFSTINCLEKKNILESLYVGQGNEYRTFYSIENGEMVELYTISSLETWDDEDKEIKKKYYYNDMEISKDKFNSYLIDNEKSYKSYSIYDAYKFTNSNFKKILK